MPSELECTLGERLDLIERIKRAFSELFPEKPQKISRGPLQNQILVRINAPLSGCNKRVVSEALSSLNYRKVKVHGYFFYRLNSSLKKTNQN